MKKIIIGILFLVILLVTSFTALAATNNMVNGTIVSYKVIVDGKVLTPGDGSPIIGYNGRTYVPIRFVAESMGADVDWRPANYSDEFYYINSAIITSKTQPILSQEAMDQINSLQQEIVRLKTELTTQKEILQTETNKLNTDKANMQKEINSLNTNSSNLLIKIEALNNLLLKNNIVPPDYTTIVVQ